MSHVYVTSDWHFGHKEVTKFRTQFPNGNYHDDYILGNALAILTKRDVLYCLGDMAFTMEGLAKIAEVPCRKILVRGNHDTLSTAQYSEVFDEIEGSFRYKKYWFTHIPIHPSELYQRKNIHGHCHRGGPAESQADPHWSSYFNAILEFNDYLPVNMQQVGTIMQERYKVEHNCKYKSPGADNGQRDWVQESSSYVQRAASAYVEDRKVESGDKQ